MSPFHLETTVTFKISNSPNYKDFINAAFTHDFISFMIYKQKKKIKGNLEGEDVIFH